MNYEVGTMNDDVTVRTVSVVGASWPNLWFSCSMALDRH